MAEDLSVEAAVSLLGAADTDATEETQQPEIEASSTEAEDTGEALEPGDGEIVETETEAEAEPVEAPTWWTPDAKEQFAQLPPELRATVLEQEGKRETLSQKARQEAAESKKLSDQRAEELGAVVQTATEVFSKARQVFQSRYEGVDWVAYAQGVRDGAYSRDQYDVDRAQFEADQQTLKDTAAQAQRAHQERAKLADEKFETEIQTLAPALCDPKTGAANKRELAEYVVKNGIPRNVVDDLDAHAVGLFWKAFQFDKAQDALKSRPKTPAIPQKANVAPAAAATRTPQQRSVEQLAARLDKSGDTDDAVRLMQARRRA